MKQTRNLYLFCAFLLAMAPLGVVADTFFSDTFTNGSTINSLTPANPTATNTAYQVVSAKTYSPTPSISSNDLRFGIASTSSGVFEIQALFATNPIALVLPGDHIQLTIVFTNTTGLLALPGPASSQLGIGLYNSGGTKPLPGGASATTLLTNPGNANNWLGYAGQIVSGANRIMTRPSQASATDGWNQELVHSGSSTATYRNQVNVGSTVAGTVTLTTNAPYTEVLTITMNDVNSLAITNTLYSGPNTSGTVITNFGGIATNTTFLTGGFDAFAFGYQTKVAGNPSLIDVSSVQVTGSVTPVSGPPTISQQPIGVTVPNGGSCAFSVTATGYSVTYQWKRNGTNLLNGGNISGATASQLVISPAGPADVLSGANGYYVVVTGAGPYSTNSVTNSLAFRPATNLTWTAGGGNTWDLNNTVSWKDNNGNPTVFNYGDPVTFDDTATLKIVNLSGSFLSAASVTVDTAANYTFQSSGNFAGPGSLLFKGSGQLTLDNNSSFSGGTTISNATAYVLVKNYGGLGTGPVTLAKAGGQMEIVPAGSASLGINGDVNVADDFSIQVNGTGAFATVFLGNLNGTAGKTLTFNPKDLSTTNRFRVYGTNTLCNANIVLNGPSTSQAIFDGTVLAPYGATGSQTYNGIISGNGGIVQRGSGSTILGGQNTYSGGTFTTAGGIGFGVDSVPTTGAVVSSPIGTGPLFVSPETGSANGSGTVLAANGARTIANPVQYPTATNNQTLIIGGTNALTLTGSYALNGQDGSATAVNRTIQVNNTNTVATLSGVISDGGMVCGLIKTGTGALALGNTETYTGTTAIGAGTLLVNGALNAASSVTVSNTGTLGGSGIVNGVVTIQSNGVVAPGNSIGTLQIANNLFLGGNLSIEVNKSLVQSNDFVNVSGGTILTNTATGTVTVTNIGGPALVAGDRFVLFSKPLSNGVAMTVAGGGTGVHWNNNLATDGSIAVSFVTVTSPATNITSVVNAGKLELSWPQNYTGWRLQVQTNTLAIGLVTNLASWVTITNTDLNNHYTNTIDVVKGAVFYRMIYP